MPRIPQENIDQINNGEAEGGGKRKAIDGVVIAKLIEATEADEKASGYAGQDLKFEVVHPPKYKGTWIYEYHSYSPEATFRWKQFWDAINYDYDSDTDEVIEEGDEFILDCYTEVQAKGKRAGQLKTNIGEYLEDTPENRALADAE